MKKILIMAVIIVIGIFAFTTISHAEENTTAQISSLHIASYPSKTVYGAFDQLDTTGLRISALLNDGTEKNIPIDQIRIAYKRDNCLRVGDNSVTLYYGSKSVSLPVTVNRIAYDLTELELESLSAVFNGKHQTYGKMIPKIVGRDGIKLSMNISGGGINVGTYDVTIDFTTESKDYLTPESRVIRLVINPAEATVVWDGNTFVYDGKSKLPVAYYNDVNGVRVYPTVSGAAINAGTGYVATVQNNDSNYVLSNTSFTYEIKKADYDLSGATWSRDSFTYDGNSKSISLAGLPHGVSVIGYSGDRGVDAGIYTVTAMLSWDEVNYNAPPELTHVWKIEKADYDMSSVNFKNSTFVYDGKIHYPTLVGSMPIGADGITLEYSFSSGACHVSDGKVSVVISFYTDSPNYNIPQDIYSAVSVTPCGIEIAWGDSNIEYIGKEQTPSAGSEYCSITVSGGGINVGKYVATAKPDSDDYYIKNDKFEYRIVKAKNYWIESPTDSTCFEGREIKLTGQSRFGEAVYTFYSNLDCTEKIKAPTECGKYYVVISISETENYEGLKSSPISLDVIKVEPVSLLASVVKNKLHAFDIIGADDIVCSLLNNDGSLTSIDSALVVISYENGDSLRRADSKIVIRYREFVFNLPVTVDYADYDLSYVKWVNTEHVYDGMAKSPILEGLPMGVTVEEYLGAENINAGVYNVTALLRYDEENYNQPIISSCRMVIKKCTVNVLPITAQYNGTNQSPNVSSQFYFITGEGEYIGAGRYSVVLSLFDPINYAFEDGASVGYAVYEILPARLCVSVADQKLKLFEAVNEAEYTITSGRLFSDDVLTVSTYEKEGRVFVKSENPNYFLEVTSGKIIRLPYPTWRGALIILAWLMSVILFVFTVIFVYRKRHKLATGIAIIKCRWHNRGYKAPMPRGFALGGAIKVDNIQNETGAIDRFYGKSETKEDGCDEPILSESQISTDTSESDSLSIDANKADNLITDSLAKSLLCREGEVIVTAGYERAIVNVGDISDSFCEGETVDVNSLKQKGLVPMSAAYVKVLGGGKIDKPLTVYANEFSLSAIKMIALTGGKVVKVITYKQKVENEKDKTT